MELDLIWHITIKLHKIELYEEVNLYMGKPYTEKLYLSRKRQAQNKIKKTLAEYRNNPTYAKKINYFDAVNEANEIVGFDEYKRVKEDIEVLKAKYSSEIPLRYWNVDDFLKIKMLMQNGGINSVSEALRYIDTY